MATLEMRDRTQL